MSEFELKFQIDPPQLADIESAVEGYASRPLRMVARYYDTADRRLTRQGLSLRIRREGDRWLQTLKGTTSSSMLRLEDNVPREVSGSGSGAGSGPGSDSGSDDGPAVDPALHVDGEASRRLHEALAGQATKGGADAATAAVPLVCLYASDFSRRRFELAGQDCRVEVALDTGAIVAGDVREPLCEIEFELLEGDPRGLIDLAGQWARDHGLHLSTLSKAQRGDQLSRGVQHGPAVKSAPAEIDRGMTLQRILRRMVAACLEQVLPNVSELAAGSPLVEHVHQLRVALRRLRTVLRELGLPRTAPMAGQAASPVEVAGMQPTQPGAGPGTKSLEPTVDAAWEPVLARVFRELGQQRDRDVALTEVQSKIEAALGSFPALPGPTLPLRSPAEIVRDADFQQVLLQLLKFSLDAEDGHRTRHRHGTHADHGKAVTRLVRRRLERLRRQVEVDGAQFESLPAASQHRVRKRLKRLRYLAELSAPLFEPEDVRRYLKRLSPAQDALGEHNDLAVALDLYHAAFHAGEPEAMRVIDWLRQALRDSSRRCRKSIDRVADAKAFW